jgi:quinol monooxygenase YgiN
MWAQLIRVRLQPGADLPSMADLLEDYEQEDSGLLRELFMHEVDNPDSAYILAVFESEEKARQREQDPRRAEGQQATQELMAKSLAGPPEFTDLSVIAEWIP